MNSEPQAIEVHTPGEAKAISPVPMGIDAMLSRAIDANVPADTLERLMALYERSQAIKAAQEFAVSMARFKSICPPVPRRTENIQFKVSRNGQQVARKYAALEDIEATIRGPLGECGLSFRWTGVKIEGTQLSMECVVSHTGGHSVSSPVTLPVTSSAGCSEAQKYGAAMTYAQRFSLIQALGLTTCEEDADGNGPPQDYERVSVDQATAIDAALTSVGGDRGKMLAYLQVEKISDIPAAKYKQVMASIERKRKAS